MKITSYMELRDVNYTSYWTDYTSLLAIYCKNPQSNKSKFTKGGPGTVPQYLAEEMTRTDFF